jgi:two-component system chemotaxis response regulator CheB
MITSSTGYGMPNHDIIVMGASAGGVEALLKLVPQLRHDLPAAVFVVLHTTPRGPGLLAHMLDRAGPLKAVLAEDHAPIQHGTIYVAPPDYHLLVHRDYMRIERGPRENRVRPAIDPLFRSAAVAYGSRVIGVLLTGLLDDGTAGLLAVKRCGGVAVVQHPDDAVYKDMPSSALSHVEVDDCLPLANMGKRLNQLVHEPAGEPIKAPEDIVIEVEMAEHMESAIRREPKRGTPVPYGCPSCGGPLWEWSHDGLQRYRCHVGHAFTQRALIEDQDEAFERALWVALRTLEERTNMLMSLAQNERDKSRHQSAAAYETQASESRTHVQTLRGLLHTTCNRIQESENE